MSSGAISSPQPEEPAANPARRVDERPTSRTRGSIVDECSVLADLGDLCRAAGLREVAEAAYDLWEDVQLEHREELLEAEKRWT